MLLIYLLEGTCHVMTLLDTVLLQVLSHGSEPQVQSCTKLIGTHALNHHYVVHNQVVCVQNDITCMI